MKKKIAVLILSLVLLITTGPAALAAGSPTITINTADSGRSYGAYQVFAGDVSGTNLTDITWGTGVDGASLTAALAAQYDSISTDMSAAQIAGAIQAMKLEENTGGADELAQIIGQHLAGSCAGSAESEKGYTIALADGPGYYLVRDERVPETGACTQNILTYSGTTVTPKESSPTVDKKVSNGTDYDKTAVWSEGDIFDFQITGTLPTDYEAYSAYYYKFTDTFQTVGGKSVFDYCGSPKILVINGRRETDITGAFTITENADGTGLSAVCTDLRAISGAEITADSRIVFTYNARLNANAIIGGTGNYNKVDLTYSNNPNAGGDGDHGTTPESKVAVFTFRLDISKVDSQNTAAKLSGAQFRLYRMNGTAKEYAVLSGGYVTGWAETSDTTVTTDDNGAADVTGIGTGTFYLEETAAPAGYVKLISDVSFTVNASVDRTEPARVDVLTVTSGSRTEKGSAADGTVTVTVMNSKESTSPYTGITGSMTTVLCALAAASAVILLCLRRKQAG